MIGFCTLEDDSRVLIHKENCPLVPQENVVGRKKILFILSKGNKS
jgi:hypothetical protein